MRTTRFAVLALAALPLGGAASAGGAPGQAHRSPALGPLPPVSSPSDNPTTEAKVELGKLLFWDTRLSGDVSTSCAPCHDPTLGWGAGHGLVRGHKADHDLSG